MVSSSISLEGKGQSGVKCYEGACILASKARLDCKTYTVTSFQDTSNIATTMKRVQGTFSM